MTEFPTSYDIFLETDGQKIAVVQSYAAKPSTNDQYHIELDRVYLTDKAIQSEINFHELKDFNLVVCKPGHKIIYFGCRWSSISEAGTLGTMAIDHVSAISARREEARP